MHDQFEHCAGVVRDRDRDRYIATLFAPEATRGALFALYAFGAEIARIRDVAREPIPGEIRLQWWREVLLGERNGEAAANPVAAALLGTIARYNLSRERLVELIEAHRFDIYDEPMASVAELQSYASKTDGTIFDMAARILDEGIGPAVAPLAAEAGSVQTIANMLALLPRHSARRQLYLPLELLRHYGAAAEDIFALRTTAELRAVLAEFRLRARRHLNRIGETIVEIPTRAQAAFLPLAPLRLWLFAMERPDYDPFRPPEIAPWRRQWRIWRAARSPQRIGK
ncbi:MAG: phytoene/squalene synthase family protein [Pseudolabrys sp.]